MRLPEEILTRIFARLIPEQAPINHYGHALERDSYQTLRSVCLASRTFRRIAQPILHHTVCLGERSERDEIYLLRTLLEAPDLARSVRALTLAKRTAAEPRLPYLEEVFASGLAALDVPETFRRKLERTRPDRSHGPWGKFFSLILALTTSVEHVSVVATPRHLFEHLFWQLGGQIETENGDVVSPSPGEYANFGLPRLRTVSLYLSEARSDPSIADVELVFLHPRLRSLTLRNFNWDSEALDDSRWSDRVSAELRSLSVHYVNVDGDGLRDAFHRFPHLQSLSLQPAAWDSAPPILDSSESASESESESSSSESAPSHWSSGPIGDVLRECGSGLQELSISGAYEYFDTLGSLLPLKSLRKVEINIAALIPRDNFDDEDCESDDEVNMNGRDEYDKRIYTDYKYKVKDGYAPKSAQHLQHVLPSSIEEMIVPSLHGSYIGMVLEIINEGYFERLQKITLRMVCRCSWRLPVIPENEIPGWTYLERSLQKEGACEVHAVNFVRLPTGSSMGDLQYH